MKDQKEIIGRMLEKHISERRACEIIGFNRSSIRYKEKNSEWKTCIVNKILDVAHTYNCYGYKKITQLLKRLGYVVNKKRVFAVWQDHELALYRKKKRKRTTAPWERPHKATAVDEVWCYDFLFVRTEHGETLKILVVLDEFSRECLGIKVDRKLKSKDVVAMLEEIMQKRKKPKYVRSDNGPEFVAKKLRKWLGKHGIRPQYIEPGKPWQNGFAESFNARFRVECLDRETFWSRTETQVVCDWWQQVYNYFRPHSSLGWRTPKEVANGVKATDVRSVKEMGLATVEAPFGTVSDPLQLPRNLTRSVEAIY